MQDWLPTLVGFLAGSLGAFSLVPQVVKCWRTGDAAAVSLRTFAVRTFGLALWTIYGFVVGSTPVLVFSILGFILSTTIMVLKVRCSRSDGAETLPPPAPERA
jgi:MtN3 and saliva related transmembrane protein